MTAEKKAVKFKRRRYLVVKKFQLKYVGLILLLMFLTAALCSYVVYYTSMLLLGEKLANVYPQGRLISIVKIVNFRILLSVILITPLVTIIGIFLSHRIAGPLYRMESFMANLAGGNLASHLILREKDELIMLANGINRVVDSLRDTVVQEKTYSNKIKSEFGSLKQALEAKPIDQTLMNSTLSRMSVEINALNAALEKYKL